MHASFEHIISPNTRKAYTADWERFYTWCCEHHKDALPASADTIADYVRELGAAHRLTTIRRNLAAITAAHRHSCPEAEPCPTKSKLVWRVIDELAMVKGELPEHRKPLGAKKIIEIISNWEPGTLIDIRDRAILLFGYAGAFKRGELAALTLSQLVFDDDGVAAMMQKLAVDGRRLVKVIHRSDNPATCPVNALKDWLESSGVTEGPVFRAIDRHGNVKTDAITPQSMSLVIKRLAGLFGIPAADLSSHSFRAGFITDMYAAGVKRKDIMLQTGHRRTENMEHYETVARRMRTNYTKSTGL
ncbi:MAG: site-specific integrase [Armatimonadota bacterium]